MLALPRILCVDDEPQVLEGLRDGLRRRFEVHAAASGAHGLEMLGREPDAYAVVISDMRMPAMSGAAFLSEARRVAPRAVRMLLTGYADLEAASRAVNEGRIFRFLTKPCEREDLLQACMDAVIEHRLAMVEASVVEQTLRGTIQALTDVLSLTRPAAFRRGLGAQRSVGRLAREIGLRDASDVEAAAMLVHLGAVVLPPSIAERLYTAQPLSDVEADMAARLPEATERILRGVPGTEGILQIAGTYARELGSPERPETSPLGVRMLWIALDYEDLLAQGLSDGSALRWMQSRPGAYDPPLLATFARLVATGRSTGRGPEAPVAARVTP